MERERIQISVIIPTRNRAAKLARCLEAYREADSEGIAWEVIVADNGSSDDTAEVVRRFAASVRFPVRYVVTPKGGASRTRNAGFAASRGEILVLTDDDCYPTRNCLREALSLFENDALGAASGRILPFDPADGRAAIMDMDFPIRYPAREIRFPMFLLSGNAAVRRAAWEQVGGFDPRLGPGTCTQSAEDHDFFLRICEAGWDQLYHPPLTVYHDHGRKLGDPATERYFRVYLYGVGAYFLKHCLRSRYRVQHAKCFYWHLRNLIRDREAYKIPYILMGGIRYLWSCLTIR